MVRTLSPNGISHSKIDTSSSCWSNRERLVCRVPIRVAISDGFSAPRPIASSNEMAVLFELRSPVCELEFHNYASQTLCFVSIMLSNHNYTPVLRNNFAPNRRLEIMRRHWFLSGWRISLARLALLAFRDVQNSLKRWLGLELGVKQQRLLARTPRPAVTETPECHPRN